MRHNCSSVTLTLLLFLFPSLFPMFEKRVKTAEKQHGSSSSFHSHSATHGCQKPTIKSGGEGRQGGKHILYLKRACVTPLRGRKRQRRKENLSSVVRRVSLSLPGKNEETCRKEQDRKVAGAWAAGGRLGQWHGSASVVDLCMSQVKNGQACTWQLAGRRRHGCLALGRQAWLGRAAVGITNNMLHALHAWGACMP